MTFGTESKIVLWKKRGEIVTKWSLTNNYPIAIFHSMA